MEVVNMEFVKCTLFIIWDAIRVIFRAAFLCLLIGLPIGCYGAYYVFIEFAKTVDYTTLEDFDFYGQRVRVLDEEGNLIKIFYEDKDTVQLSTTDIRPDYLNFIVSIEDKRFYEHNGVDLKGILRALHVNLIDGGSLQGASTITQQLVRSQVLTTEKTIVRKLTEICLALELETRRTKHEILEMYLNTAYFGYGNYGIESASRFYYGTTLNKITLSQLCSLIPIVQSPNNFNPVNNLELNNQKRTTILNSLHTQGIIDDELLNMTLADESYKDVKMSREQYNQNVTEVNSYYIESAYEQVLEDLILYKGLTREDAISYLKDNGCKIYTYYDAEIESILKDLGETRYEAIDDEIQTAITILDNEGRVRGILGGYDKKPVNYSLNRAIQSTRSPGSTFKPIVSYSSAFEKLGLTSTSIVRDVKREYGTLTGIYAPNNYNHKYLGNVPVHKAVALSINSVAVELLHKVGVVDGFAHAKKLGITTLVDNRNGYTDKGLSMALGGLTDGVTVIDMATAYNSLKTGQRMVPKFYHKVVDNKGNNVLISRDLPKYNKQVVLKDTTVAYTLDTLADVVQSGTGRLLKDAKARVLGKTGTTNDEKDLWFVGATPSYTISLWYGYDAPKPIRTSDAHVKLYKELVNRLVDTDKEKEDMFTLNVPKYVLNSLVNKNLFITTNMKEEVEYLIEDYTESTNKPKPQPQPPKVEKPKEEIKEEIQIEVPIEIPEDEVLNPDDDLFSGDNEFVEPVPNETPVDTTEEPTVDTPNDSSDIISSDIEQATNIE